jgi:integrase
VTQATDIPAIIAADKESGREKRTKREAGTGCLIPPRLGITRYWAVQVRDTNGKLVRRTRLNSGAKVKGELKPGIDATDKELLRKPESWTNISAARVLLKEWVEKVSKGDAAVGHDPSQLHYADLRALYLRDYAEQGHKSLRKSAETGVEYVDCLPHLDTFMGFEQEGDEGLKISAITSKTRDAFVAQRREEGAANATINRSLAALRRMFTLAIEDGILKFAPVIKMLPEAGARTGFLEIEEYNKLYEALGTEVKNQATGKVSWPYAYVQPFLQIGFYTGMRLGEIKNLRWDCVDLKNNVIRLGDADVKNEEGREIPLIDGLPELLEGIKRANPNAEYVFLRNGEPIKSFRKAWKIATKKAGLEGFLFHDLRRSAARNLVRAGVPRSIAMKITGHKTESVFERYNITDSRDIQTAGQAVTKYLKEQQAAAEVKKPETKLTVVA